MLQMLWLTLVGEQQAHTGCYRYRRQTQMWQGQSQQSAQQGGSVRDAPAVVTGV